MSYRGMRVTPQYVTCRWTFRTLMCITFCKLTFAQYTWVFPSNYMGTSCTSICKDIYGTTCYSAALAGWSGWPTNQAMMQSVLTATGTSVGRGFIGTGACAHCPAKTGSPNNVGYTYYDASSPLAPQHWSTCDSASAYFTRFCPCTNKPPPPSLSPSRAA